MSETVNLESLAVVGEKLQRMSDASRSADLTGSLGLSAGALVVEQAYSELTRLRTLIDGLIKAVEPFADQAAELSHLFDEEQELSLVTKDFDSNLDITVGDLRRAREAYLKAKGETNVG